MKQWRFEVFNRSGFPDVHGQSVLEDIGELGIDLTIGSVLEEQGEQGTENAGKKVRGKDMTSLEDIVMGDADREIECPLCGCMRMVEPDAAYTYTCEDCGAEVKVPCIM